MILEALVGESDLGIRAGVIFHELCHMPYVAQSRRLQADLDSWFAGLDTGPAIEAKKLFNETLATAIGNGIAYQKVAGKLDETPWYNSEKIDQAARAGVEVVRPWVAEGRTISREFVLAWVEAFRKSAGDKKTGK